MTVLQQENPRRQFVPSSPSDGAETVKEGYVAQNPYSDLYGDGKSSFWTDLWVRNHWQTLLGSHKRLGNRSTYKMKLEYYFKNAQKTVMCLEKLETLLGV